MLEYSALLFIIPAVYAWYKNNLDYGNAFLFLTITSYIYHTSNKYMETTWRFWIDQFAILNIVLIGLYNYITYCKNYYCKLFIFICFISCIILHLLNKFIINEKTFSEIIHLSIHLVTFVAHSLIISRY